MKKVFNMLVVFCMMMSLFTISVYANEECEHVWERYYTTDRMSTSESEGEQSIHCEVCDAVNPSSITRIPAGSVHVTKVYMESPEVEIRLYNKVDADASKYPNNAVEHWQMDWSSEDESIATVNQSGIITGVSVGTTTIYATSRNGVVGSCEVTVYASEYDKINEVERIYGDNRYQTSFEVGKVYVKERFSDGYQNVIVASGTNYADALAGSYLAAKKNAVILMANANKDMELPGHYGNWYGLNCEAYILGGTSAVGTIFERHFKNYETKTIRLAGNDRYATNLEILKEAGIDDEPILVCTGNGFADSLSASAVGYPILLVNKTLSTKQKEFLSSLNGNQIIIIGGTSAVSTSIESQLRQYGSVERLAGQNRYETSVLVAERFFENPEYAVLAYAKNFPDGLSGGSLAYLNNGPLLLTDNNNWEYAANYVQENGIVRGAVLGGPTLISSETVENIFNSKPNTMEVYSHEENGVTTDLYIVSSGGLVISINEVKTMSYNHKDVPNAYTLIDLYDRYKKVYTVEFTYDTIHDRYGSYYTQSTFVDYSKADFEELVKYKLVNKVDDVVPQFISYAEYTQFLVEKGYTKKVIY